MKRLLLVILSLLMVVFLFASCGTPEQSPSENISPEPAPSPQPAPAVDPVKDPEPDIPEISDDEVSKSYNLCQPFVEQNFYLGSPERDLDPDWSVTDSNYANPSQKYHTLDEFRTHVIKDYPLSEKFVDSLLDRVSMMLFEHDGGLYVVSAGRGSDIEVGNEINRSVIREGDTKIILRITHEKVDDTTGDWKVVGSFDVDNVMIYEYGNWVWDDIVEYR
ncbi:MAG: hypothetical protein Q4D71_04965 [Oscillospiraceae bacterium]|nr:hypothetical protein [Oscillospiraceae bacterium]